MTAWTVLAKKGMAGGLVAAAMLAAMPEPAALARDEPATTEAGSARGAVYGFLAGSYWLIGKRPDGDVPYQGRVRLENRGDHLAVERTIAGVTSRGEARIEPLTVGEGEVLRLRFREAGTAFEATYLFQSDPDNYARLSGYVYRPGQPTGNPGLEALFIAHEP